MVTQNFTCRKCGSINIRKNGKTVKGDQKIHCKDCNFYSTLTLKADVKASKMEIAEKLFLERTSQRAIARITGISRPTLAKKLKKTRSSQ